MVRGGKARMGIMVGVVVDDRKKGKTKSNTAQEDGKARPGPPPLVGSPSPPRMLITLPRRFDQAVPSPPFPRQEMEGCRHRFPLLTPRLPPPLRSPPAIFGYVPPLHRSSRTSASFSMDILFFRGMGGITFHSVGHEKALFCWPATMEAWGSRRHRRPIVGAPRRPPMRWCGAAEDIPKGWTLHTKRQQEGRAAYVGVGRLPPPHHFDKEAGK